MWRPSLLVEFKMINLFLSILFNVFRHNSINSLPINIKSTCINFTLFYFNLDKIVYILRSK